MFVDTYITFLVLKVSLNSTVNKEHVLVYRQVSEYILFYSKNSIFCLKIGLITLISLLQTGVGPLKTPKQGAALDPVKIFPTILSFSDGSTELSKTFFLMLNLNGCFHMCKTEAGQVFAGYDFVN